MDDHELSKLEKGVMHQNIPTDNTNVIKFVSLLQNDIPDQQLIYYQPGIGTYTNPGIFTPLTMKIANILDEAVAWYIGAHITGGYRWLMDRYQVGDRICIFGFSRGAYTARALAGMINKVGLLPPGNHEQVTIAYDIYRTDTEDGYTLGDGFRDTFSRVVPIEFVGVWDSVSSVGIVRSHTLPYAASNNIIATFRHAMALDERRGWFVVDPWHIRPMHHSGFFGGLLRRRKHPNDQSWLARCVEWLTFGGCKQSSEIERQGRVPGETAKKLFTSSPNLRSPTDVKEVWFAGCHSDVGGGNVLDSHTHGLSNITLRWMVRECVMANAKIVWNEPRLRQLRIDISPERLGVSQMINTNAPILSQLPTAPSYEETFAPQLAQFEDRDEAMDARSRLHDSLVFKTAWTTWLTCLLWWILEFLPMKQWSQDTEGKWRGSHRSVIPFLGPNGQLTRLYYTLSINVGRPRTAAPCTGKSPLFHISVLAKEQNRVEGELVYKPRVILKDGKAPMYVD
ncbi:hypothetical protein RHS04_03599 [Rhizoctonia solani]|uniref:T6SS Phospholipase effector Tle1-like catalytic domain-containing protein n=2 Tax=Rhizoctonia solani TaxID=456999 RepID=A0A8H7HB33_9AGAM|nr:hypothetical protein RHS04_03599 [Rhizoctonia solani]